MKNIGTYLKRTLSTAVAVAALTLAPAAVNAATIEFEVDEGAVGGDTSDQEFDATGLTGKYFEFVTLTPDAPGSLTGDFTATLYVEFASYVESSLVDSELGDTYGLYALVSVEGTYEQDPNEPAPGFSEFFFQVSDATADVYTDPEEDTVLDNDPLGATNDSDDQHILTAQNGVIPGFPSSYGEVTVCTTLAGCGNDEQGNPILFGDVTGGNYVLRFVDPELVDPDGPAYWPGLADFTLTLAISSGDIDPTNEGTGTTFPDSLVGDASISFQGERNVPEPMTLSLLGIGLAGTGYLARRRRHQA